MSRYEEILKEIQCVGFVSDIIRLEKECLVALHRCEINREQYDNLRIDCDCRLIEITHFHLGCESVEEN